MSTGACAALLFACCGIPPALFALVPVRASPGSRMFVTINLDAIRKAAAANVGKAAKADGPITITVKPATFVSKGKGKTPAGEIMVGCKVGNAWLAPEHVQALCNALGVTPDAKLFAKLFGG